MVKKINKIKGRKFNKYMIKRYKSSLKDEFKELTNKELEEELKEIKVVKKKKKK